MRCWQRSQPWRGTSGSLNWSKDTLISNWDGITISGGRVSEIELTTNKGNLNGNIPAEFGHLSALTHLHFWDNASLTGNIPAALGHLSNLTVLALRRNKLTGAIPPELANLSAVEQFLLDDNELTGEIPPELANLSTAQYLLLSRNQLTGEIPPELGNLSSLLHLELRDNQLSGEIPPELANISTAIWLYLDGNQLTGEIPPELAHLPVLQYLYLNDNQLTGEIPPELANIDPGQLQELHLHGNQLTTSVSLNLVGASSVSEGAGATVFNFTAEVDPGTAWVVSFLKLDPHGRYQNDRFAGGFAATGSGQAGVVGFDVQVQGNFSVDVFQSREFSLTITPEDDDIEENNETVTTSLVEPSIWCQI